MDKTPIFFKPVTYLFFVLYIAFAYSVLAMGDKVVATMLPEDHYFENVGAISLFLTFILFFYGFHIGRKTLDTSSASFVKKLVYLGLALLFFFGAGEEINWGQRIFGFQTPASLAQMNKQNELNFHDLAVLEDSKFLTADRMFDVFWFLFGVLSPAIALAVSAFRRFVSKWIPIVYWGLGALFLYNYLWAKLATILLKAAYTFDKISFAQSIQEIKESNYALIFILVAWFAIWDLQYPTNRSIPIELGLQA